MASKTDAYIVGKYPADLLLDILSDGMDWAARGFWAQINKYKWYWWYVCDEKGEPEYPQVINRELVKSDTSLIQMRDDSDISEVYQYLNIHDPEVNAIEHRHVDDGDTTFCGLNHLEGDWDTFCPAAIPQVECKECAKWVDITLEKMATATDWALETHNHLFSWHTNRFGIRDEIDYDAVGADAILQKIVLDGVIYG